ncbi:MAG TPA: TolC family protein [Verrucomicrobiae bacterium]|nr:TolC family protein [Verrucomicrobiae bacterium]
MRTALALMLSTAAAWAAEKPAINGPLELSLKRAVAIAIAPEGSAKVQLSTEAEKQAESRSAEARAALLPDLSAAFSEQNMTRNLAAVGIQLQLPVLGIQFPTFVGPFSVMDARISGTQSVFDFSSIRRYQAAKVGITAAKADLNGTEEQVASQVARAYLAAVKADADVETAKANMALSEALQKQAENLKAAGTGTGIEITRARVQLANDRQRLLVAENAQRAARLQLLRAMGMRLDTDLLLTDKLAYTPVDAVTLEAARAQAIQERPDYKAQQERESNARLSYSATKMERLPSVSAFGDYGASGTGFDSSLPTRTVGVSVRIPIFDGGRRDARRAESASQYRAEKVKTGDLKEQIELDVRLALDSLRSAEDEVSVAKEGLELAQNELTQARRRNDAGVAIALEITDAQTRLERAQDNQTAALYNYNLARIDLAQAMGAVRRMVQ